MTSLLRAGHTDYVLNEVAFGYLRSRGPPAALITRLAEADETRFADKAVWQAHLGRLGIVSPPEAGLAVIRDPVQVATEGAVSAPAGRFIIGNWARIAYHDASESKGMPVSFAR